MSKEKVFKIKWLHYTWHQCTCTAEQVRQLDIVDTDNMLSADDKDRLINAEDFGAVQQFLDQKYALSDATNDELVSRLTDLEHQHDGLLKIERSVRELNALFTELNVLVIGQQDLIDSVEDNVVSAKEQVKAGTRHLEIAERHQKKTRKMMVIGIVCCVVVLLIVILILFT